MLLKKSKNYNPNYLATISRVKNVREHPNADKLNLGTVDGYTIVIGKEVKEEDLGIFFLAETQISDKFLSFCNLYRDRDLNKNKSFDPGFFEKNRRVRAIKLRGIISEGFWIEIDKFMSFLADNYSGQGKIEEGTSFDTIGKDLFCNKYEKPVKKTSQRKKEGKKSKISLIVDGQFKFHKDTEQLQRNMFRINKDDTLHISYKLHGSSGISGNLLVKDMSFRGKIKRLFGINAAKYDNIYSSRRVIKNEGLNSKKGPGFYDEDIWGKANKIVSPHLDKGMTAYYEIVGYVGGESSKMIQKDYDYGCKQGELDVYIYRITTTNVDGKVNEYSALQVQEWCKEKGLNAVPELYQGTLEEFYDEIDYNDKDWRDLALSRLKENFINCYKECYMCNNKVPNEGIVIRKENTLGIEAYKLKNPEFLLRETKQLDKN